MRSAYLLVRPTSQTTSKLMHNDELTKISASGLRYLAKEKGSPFQTVGAPGETRSCIKCGQHKARSNGSIQRYLNVLMFFCFDCRPVKKMR